MRPAVRLERRRPRPLRRRAGGQCWPPWRRPSPVASLGLAEVLSDEFRKS